MQGSYGDNKTESPSYLQLVDRLKWNSYESQKGMEKHAARVTFINGAKQMLADRGFPSENPHKEQME
jgi:acyl-CoA-binding protein